MRLMAIEWIDSCGPDGWTRTSEVETSPVVCRSVGWIIAESEEAMTIAPHLGPDSEDPQCNGAITIPKVCVTKRRAIRWPFA